MTEIDPKDLSPVFARAEKIRPRVKQPDSPWTVPLGLAGAAALGVMVFGALSNGREAKAQPQPVQAAPPPAPQPPAPPPVQPVPQYVPPPPAPAMQAPVMQQDTEARYRSPTMIVDLSAPGATGGAPAAVAVATAAPTQAPEDATRSADERFAARASGSSPESVRAYQMRDLARVVPQGAVIPAVLETALNSDLPGSVRGVVSREVRSFDGSQVLIPRGSRLIGQYKSAVAIGQTRAFVVWSRLITPGGVTIDLGSPAADRLGRGGLDGDVNTHFFKRFGSAILLSVVTGGIAALAADGGSSGDTNLIIGSPTQASRVAEIALQKNIDIPVTIKVAQGTPVQVFVARDLDFSAVSLR